MKRRAILVLITAMSALNSANAAKQNVAQLPDRYGDITFGMLLKDAAALDDRYIIEPCDQAPHKQCLVWTDVFFGLDARFRAVPDGEQRIYFISGVISRFMKDEEVYPCPAVYDSIRESFLDMYGKPSKKRGVTNWIWSDGDTEIQIFEACYGDKFGTLSFLLKRSNGVN